jgi:putative transposase
MDYLPRLKPEFYRGDAVVHWTLTIFDRGKGWLNDIFHVRFRELSVHVCAREGLVCPCYCLMPDHLHLVWMGLHAETDQRNGMAFFRTHLEPLLAPHWFQPQAYDHVLGDDERRRGSFAQHCAYVLQNPVRAGLATAAEPWSFCGTVVAGYPKLHPFEENFWTMFWKLYEMMREPNADANRFLPRRST